MALRHNDLPVINLILRTNKKQVREVFFGREKRTLFKDLKRPGLAGDMKWRSALLTCAIAVVHIGLPLFNRMQADLWLQLQAGSHPRADQHRLYVVLVFEGPS